MLFKSLLSIGCCLLLAGCSATSGSQINSNPQSLFVDNSFIKPSDFNEITDIYYLTEQQKAMLDESITPSVSKSFTEQIVDNLLHKDYRAFDYDNSFTRTASQTLESKQGNCLSMVILSVAMAKHFNLKFKIYDVKTAPVWNRNGGLFLVNGHVNVQLQNTNFNSKHSVYEFLQNEYYTLDFLPRETRRSLVKQRVTERQLAAMYFSNIAADAMVQREWDRAYWLLKESIAFDPYQSAAWNSLAVLYRYNNQEALAEQVYHHALALAPQDTNVIANLAILLSAQGRYQELFEYQRQINLAELQNPFRYFDQAEYAMSLANYDKAVNLYKKAIKLSPHVDQFYFGLYKSYLALDRDKLALKNLKLAKEKSATVDDRARYNDKLALITNM
ncbi:tetratricopeptide repeat protein [Psychrobium sp. nBUS_13]|uniref:tetratricopeptide repeat protein n=1 Tax=Psychrobium sp. nBUS_13 TaxID=3395319 RepID=UPI003EBB78A3